MAGNNTALQTTATFETALGQVTISFDDIKKFLCRGNQTMTDQECKLFLELCKYQKLNPYTNECYPVKFNDDFQIIIGYDTYKRRAEENPNYSGRKSGIVVLRGEQVIQKEGTCLYPSESLIGGWCRVYRLRPTGDVEEVFREVSLAEYDRKIANWKTKPSTMIEKVAVSQALRNAFPKDFAGLYTSAEVNPDGYYDGPNDNNAGVTNVVDIDAPEPDRPVTQKERQQLFGQAQHYFGVEEGNAMVKDLLEKYGIESTQSMMKSHFDEIMKSLKTIHEETTAEYQEVPYTEVE